MLGSGCGGKGAAGDVVDAGGDDGGPADARPAADPPADSVTATPVYRPACVQRPETPTPGTFDPSFANGAKQLPRPDSYWLAKIRGVRVDAQGRILVFGPANHPDWLNWKGGVMVVRFTETGALDTGFGQGGGVAVELGAGFNPIDLQLAPDGGLYLSGTGADKQRVSSDPNDPYAERGVVLRLTANGALDASFGDGGILTVDVAGKKTGAEQMLLLDDGLLLRRQTGYPGDSSAEGLLLKLGADGSPTGWTVQLDQLGHGAAFGRALARAGDTLYLGYDGVAALSLSVPGSLHWSLAAFDFPDAIKVSQLVPVAGGLYWAGEGVVSGPHVGFIGPDGSEGFMERSLQDQRAVATCDGDLLLVGWTAWTYEQGSAPAAVRLDRAGNYLLGAAEAPARWPTLDSLTTTELSPQNRAAAVDAQGRVVLAKGDAKGKTLVLARFAP